MSVSVSETVQWVYWCAGVLCAGELCACVLYAGGLVCLCTVLVNRCVSGLYAGELVCLCAVCW